MNSKKDTWYSMKSDRFPDRLRKCFDGEVGKFGQHVSREEFSEATGIKDSAIRNYLSGQNGMKVDDLIKTADFFGVTVGYLVGHENVSLPDLELRSISKYTGLSEQSIEALHYMSHGSEFFDDDEKGLKYIIKALEFTLHAIQKENEKARYNYSLLADLNPIIVKTRFHTVFDDYYDMIEPLTSDEKKQYQISGLDEPGISPEVSYEEYKKYKANKRINEFYEKLRLEHNGKSEEV